MNEKERKLLSVIVSAFNEEDALETFYRETIKYLENIAWDAEIIFVNDGSTDKTRWIIDELSAKDKRVKGIHFSRNFGHEAAMIAGIDKAGGDGLICMDADLQHPPGVIPMVVEKFEQGVDIISMVRTSNKSAGILKNITSDGFYHLINMISDANLIKNASDFFGMSKRAAGVLRVSYRERNRFLRGYVQNIGFQKDVIEYEAGERVAGSSKYSIRKLWKFSVNTIMCFSDFPLRLGIYAGGFAAILGVLMTIYTVYTWAKVGTPSGYATIIVLMCFMFSVLFTIVGILGEYISILFAEMKDRPIYIIEETKNLEDSKNAATR